MTVRPLGPSDLLSLELTALKVVKSLAPLGRQFFGTELEVERKRDRSLVSKADRAIESAAREMLASETPETGFFGEEFGGLKRLSDLGRTKGSSPLLEALDLRNDSYWMLDPIDGTINFLTRIPLWSTLLAYIHQGEPVLGVVSLPCLDEVFIASKGNGAKFGSFAAPLSGFRPCFTRVPESLDEAFLSCSSPLTFSHRAIEGWYEALLRRRGELRTHSDAFGHTRVLCGGIDAMVDPIAAPYDLAAVQVLFDETPGAYFGSLHGDTGAFRYRSGSVIAASSAMLGMEITEHFGQFIDKMPVPYSKARVWTLEEYTEAFRLTALNRPFDKEATETQGWLRAIEKAALAWKSSPEGQTPGDVLEELTVSLLFIESVQVTIVDGEQRGGGELSSDCDVEVKARIGNTCIMLSSPLSKMQDKVEFILHALQKCYETVHDPKLVQEADDETLEPLQDHIVGHLGGDIWGIPLTVRALHDVADAVRVHQTELKAQAFAERKPPRGLLLESVLAQSRVHRTELSLNGSQVTRMEGDSSCICRLELSTSATQPRNDAQLHESISRQFTDGGVLPAREFARRHRDLLTSALDEFVSMVGPA